MKNIMIAIMACAAFCTGVTQVESAYNDTQAEVQGGLTNVGLAVFNLTAPGFNCDAYLESSSSLSSLNVVFLYNTFGNDFSCLERVLADPRLDVLEIALINEPGHRNGRLGKYEFLSGVGTVSQWQKKMLNRDPALKAKYVDYVKPLQDVLAEHLQPTTQLLINPGLESNLNDAAGRILVSWTKELFPSSRIIWNPLRASNSRRSRARADLIEGHGFFPKITAPCVFNMDGTDVAYPNRPALGQNTYQEGQTKNWIQSGPPLRQLIEDYANRCEASFVWTQESNGLSYKSKGFVDPRKRNHNISKTTYDMLFKDIVYLQNRGKIYPATYSYTVADNSITSTCDTVSSNFSDGEKVGKLLKQSEFRERGAVLILPKEFSGVQNATLVQGNKVVDKFYNTAGYKDGRVMFRSNVSPQKYPFKTFLVLDAPGKRICYRLDNARIRLD